MREGGKQGGRLGGREVRRKGRTGREGEKEEGWKKTRRMINMREGVGAGVMLEVGYKDASATKNLMNDFPVWSN